MKYIRTKDGIYETSTQNLYKNDDLLYIDGYDLERVIKQADTIEELCDEFVAMCDEYKKPFVWSNHNKDYFKEVKQFYDFCAKQNIDKHLQFLYGAIWTDKGLIYVAKMNEKGELELL